LIVGLDATFLLYLFAPAGSVGVPLDSNDQEIPHAKERIEALVEEFERTGATIIVGTPALSEIMVRAGVQAGQKWIGIMNRSRAFKIVPFDEKSAIEVAVMAGQEAKAATNLTRAKLKYDRQIVAIARTEGASVFYTDDENQMHLARRLNMTAKGLADCPLPPVAQGKLEFPESGDADDAD
jgi:predicted nucleic acid-binding protein